MQGSSHDETAFLSSHPADPKRKSISQPNQFTDAEGRTWTISFSVGLGMLIRDELGLDFLHPFEGEPQAMAVFYTDLFKRGAVLWLCCRDRAKDLGLDPYGFATSLEGAPLLAAYWAFKEALADFFRQQERKDQVAMLAKLHEAVTLMIDRAERSVESEGMQNLIATEVGKIGGSTLTKPPESSASTPVPSPSGA